MLIGYDIRAIIGKPLLGTQSPTGVPWYVVRLLRELVTQGREHEFILFANAFKKPDVSLIKDIIELPNVTLVTTRMPNKLFDHTAHFFNRPHIDTLIKKKTGKKLDIYFTPHINITPLSKNVRYALTMHDLTFELYPSFFPFRKRYWHHVQDARKSCKRANIIFSVSNHTKHDLKIFFKVDAQKIHAIHQGIILDTASSQSFEEISSRHVLPKKYMLCVGTLEPRKNIEGIIEAFSLYKQQTKDDDMHLVLGGGNGWLYKRIYKTAIRSQYVNYIHFLGYISEQDKASLIKYANVFVFPSFYEGVGVPPLEALAQGTPVVASHVSSLPEVLQNKAILVDPYNIYDIASGMYNAQQLPLEDSSVVDEFDWKIAGEKILGVISNKDPRIREDNTGFVEKIKCGIIF